jgi:PKD repeat protein
MIFLAAVVLAATPASGEEAYVASADRYGNAVYMGLGDHGLFSGPDDLLSVNDSGIGGYGYSNGANGTGDFDGDGDVDYILALGAYGADKDSVVFVIPKSDSGNQFEFPVRVATFSDKYFPSAMTVADFNGDKMLDFVVASYRSSNCWLFLNKGDGQPDVFEFEPVFLPGTSSPYNYDMDAADVNNDGMADFIVGSKMSSSPFKVNLWSENDTSDVPVPKFESRELRLDHPSPLYRKGYGVAVADFITINDENGNADLAVSNTNAVDLYQGDGSGLFTYFGSISLPMRSSPLDNGDFDRDGNQDLIAGNFGQDSGSVVVLSGDGTGYFSYLADTDIYTRGGLGQRTAVTGPAFFESNKAPVAQLTPEVITVTVGETVEWDGSGSHDEDGTIVSYEWDYGDGAVQPLDGATMSADGTGESRSSYVYYDSGTYTVTLTVTDDKGATATVQAQVQADPIGVGVSFTPRKLNKKSKGKWVTATIRVPGDYDARRIEADSLFLVPPNGKAPIPAVVSKKHRNFSKYFNKYSEKSKKKYRKARKLKVKFNRQDLIEALDGATGEITLTVMGEVSSLEFSGTGTIVAFEKQKKRSFKYFMQHLMRLLSKGKSKHH